MAEPMTQRIACMILRVALHGILLREHVILLAR